MMIAVLVGCAGGTKAPTLENKPVVDPVKPVASSAARGLVFEVVDNDSAYMRLVFAHVGMAAGGGATDPAAVAAGITVEVDAWIVEDTNARQQDHYLLAADRDGATGRARIERYIAELASTDATFAIRPDHELGFERIDATHWRSYYLFKTVELDGSAVAHAEVALDPNTGRPLVLLDFDSASSKKLGDLTARIVGKKLATILDGTIRSAPIINGAIRGGRASIAMGGTDPAAQEKEAHALVEVLSHAKP
ncbi:MAG: hypothetical protein ABI867_35670 [Kofleriaceae bacterium]